MKKESDNSKHYNQLIADWYDLLLKDEIFDIQFYKKIVTNSGKPILELACGTGRLLIEYLEQGVDVDGLDSSKPMLEKCKNKTHEAGLKTTLYHQKIEDMMLKRKYKTMFAAGGSFQLLDTLEKAMQALKKIYNLLQPGGLLVLDLFIPWEQIMAQQEGVWRLGRTATRGNLTFAAHHSDAFDLKNQVIKGKTRYELYENNKLKETYFDSLNLKWYSVNEFKLMLEKTGFIDIKTEAKHLISKHGEATVYYASKQPG
jgi:ubiquinone/menaquinone biosynthesis C-methylase UbiE